MHHRIFSIQQNLHDISKSYDHANGMLGDAAASVPSIHYEPLAMKEFQQTGVGSIKRLDCN